MENRTQTLFKKIKPFLQHLKANDLDEIRIQQRLSTIHQDPKIKVNTMAKIGTKNNVNEIIRKNIITTDKIKNSDFNENGNQYKNFLNLSQIKKKKRLEKLDLEKNILSNNRDKQDKKSLSKKKINSKLYRVKLVKSNPELLANFNNPIDDVEQPFKILKNPFHKNGFSRYKEIVGEEKKQLVKKQREFSKLKRFEKQMTILESTKLRKSIIDKVNHPTIDDEITLSPVKNKMRIRKSLTKAFKENDKISFKSIMIFDDNKDIIDKNAVEENGYLRIRQSKNKSLKKFNKSLRITDMKDLLNEVNFVKNRKNQSVKFELNDLSFKKHNSLNLKKKTRFDSIESPVRRAINNPKSINSEIRKSPDYNNERKNLSRNDKIIKANVFQKTLSQRDIKFKVKVQSEIERLSKIKASINNNFRSSINLLIENEKKKSIKAFQRINCFDVGLINELLEI